LDLLNFPSDLQSKFTKIHSDCTKKARPFYKKVKFRCETIYLFWAIAWVKLRPCRWVLEDVWRVRCRDWLEKGVHDEVGRSSMEAGRTARSRRRGFDFASTLTTKTAVNFTNILRAALAPIYFHKKITKANCKHMKTSKNTCVHKKLLVKCWWNWHLDGSGFVSPDCAVHFVVTIVVVDVVVGLDGLPMPGGTFRHYNTSLVKFSTFASQIVSLKIQNKLITL
jgi:hypothetical protein